MFSEMHRQIPSLATTDHGETLIAAVGTGNMVGINSFILKAKPWITPVTEFSPGHRDGLPGLTAMIFVTVKGPSCTPRPVRLFPLNRSRLDSADLSDSVRCHQIGDRRFMAALDGSNHPIVLFWSSIGAGVFGSRTRTFRRLPTMIPLQRPCNWCAQAAIVRPRIFVPR